MGKILKTMGKKSIPESIKNQRIMMPNISVGSKSPLMAGSTRAQMSSTVNESFFGNKKKVISDISQRS